MKLFGRSPGYYLFWAGTIYLLAGLANIQFKVVEQAWITIIWIACLLVPLTIRPIADYFNMVTIWDQIKPKKVTAMNDYTDNVYNLPKPKLVPPMPEVEKPSPTAYLVGKTEDGRVTLRMGTDHQWSQISMNNAAVDQLIAMLEAAKDPDVRSQD